MFVKIRKRKAGVSEGLSASRLSRASNQIETIATAIETVFVKNIQIPAARKVGVEKITQRPRAADVPEWITIALIF